MIFFLKINDTYYIVGSACLIFIIVNEHNKPGIPNLWWRLRDS